MSIGIFKKLIICGLALVSVNSFASQTDEDFGTYDSYEDILQKLSDSRAASSSATLKANRPSRLGTTMFHAGVGIASLYQTVELDGNAKENIENRGVQASVGIDLLSPEWLAEGTVRSFEANNLAWTKLQLKEFDLKFIYKPRLETLLGLRLGGGISARYSVYSRSHKEDLVYTTPSSIILAGFDVYLNETVSLGAEASLRTAMVGETIDQNTKDITFRIDGHF